MKEIEDLERKTKNCGDADVDDDDADVMDVAVTHDVSSSSESDDDDDGSTKFSGNRSIDSQNFLSLR
jgi:hypothetical protein